MTLTLPDLPYASDALEPHISARTLKFHHGKHHRAYVDEVNRAIEDTAYADMSLQDIVVKSHRDKHEQVFNNAAQAWNHAFLWQCMSPDGGGEPAGALKKDLERKFGSVDEFREAFSNAATGQFGSGWVWLALAKGQLKIIATSNAENPLIDGSEPLLTLDVWEHAYYLDFQNERGKYVYAFLTDLINWKFATANYRELRGTVQKR